MYSLSLPQGYLDVRVFQTRHVRQEDVRVGELLHIHSGTCHDFSLTTLSTLNDFRHWFEVIIVIVTC